MSIPVSQFTFTEQLLLNLAGPVLTVIAGGLIIGWITRKAQERREDQLRAADNRREDYTLRERLITDITQAPSALYLATQHYWRAKQENLPEDELKSFREALDAQYLDSRRTGTMLEHLLELHFADPGPTRLMHRVMDLLSIRYFQLLRPDGLSERLRKANAGEDHSGLSSEELRTAGPVLRKYHETLREVVLEVATGDLQVNPSPSADAELSASAH